MHAHGKGEIVPSHVSPLGFLCEREYHTPAGVLRQVVRETPDWCSPLHTPWQPTTFGIEKRTHYGIDLFDDWGISRRTEPWVKGPADVDTFWNGMGATRMASGCCPGIYVVRLAVDVDSGLVAENTVVVRTVSVVY